MECKSHELCEEIENSPDSREQVHCGYASDFSFGETKGECTAELRQYLVVNGGVGPIRL